MSRHPARQKLARHFGATDIVAERGEEGIEKVLEMTRGFGADCVLECVGTDESMHQAMRLTRKGGHMSFVGVPHGVEIQGQSLFFSQIHLEGGPAPVRRYLPDLIDLVLNQKIDPSPVFDLVLPFSQVAEGYKAMDERRAIKTLSSHDSKFEPVIGYFPCGRARRQLERRLRDDAVRLRADRLRVHAGQPADADRR